MIRERGLVIRGDKSDVAAVLLRGLELEIIVAQTDQHGGGADGTIYRKTLGGGVDDDLFPDRPVPVPPGIGGAGECQDGKRAEDQALCKVAG